MVNVLGGKEAEGWLDEGNGTRLCEKLGENKRKWCPLIGDENPEPQRTNRVHD
jgi:hypothetical protein